MNINHKPTYEERISAALNNTATAFARKGDLIKILSAALKAVDPQSVVRNNLWQIGDELRVGSNAFRLTPKARLVTAALGKAAPAMLTGAILQLDDYYGEGLCICKHLASTDTRFPGTRYILGNHPVPGAGSLRAGEALKNLASGLGEEDVMLLLLSGGGSALATLPANGITLEEMQQVTVTLLHAGASIHEINTVRKHLDLLKGGGLARLASPARVVTLVLSDVVGNNLEVIASGPSYPDPSTFADALEIVERAAKHGVIPARIRHHLEKGCRGELPETLKPTDTDARRSFNILIASNVNASAAAVAQAKALGFTAETVTNELMGEARAAGAQIASMVKVRSDLNRPFLLVWGGETTVVVKGRGKGGRNQELALGAVRELSGVPNILLVSLATDGEDGPTDAAGALVTGDTLNRAMVKGLNPESHLCENDAYSFFERIGDILRTGPTGTNVNDLIFVFGF